MSLSIGIVGFPNVGKSTLFNALLKKQIALVANYPFATIEPNVGIAEVPDERLPILAKIVKTSVIKPATVTFTDIAGLVKGASKGEGLGNKFLAHIRETQAICHVLRAFSDDNVIREGTTTPREDLENIRLELRLADMETLEKQHPPKASKDKEELKKWTIIEKFKKRIEQNEVLIQKTDVDEEFYEKVAKELSLLSTKPEIFVINVNEEELKNYQELKQKFAKELQVDQEKIVVISAQIESELASLSLEDQQAYLQELGIEKSGLERLATVAYHTLKLQSFLTAGEIEVRAWTIPKNCLAPVAAGVIHTDFAKNFIKAKVVNYADFVKFAGWQKAKEAGKVRLEGKDYQMQEGDLVEFLIQKG